MRLLRVEHSMGALYQGVVRTEWPSGSSVSALKSGIWARLFYRSTQLWGQLQPLSCGLRVEMDPRKGLSTVHSFVVSEDNVKRLRAVLAAFLRTDGLASGRTDVPQDESPLDNVFLHPGALRMRLAREPLSTSNGLKISHDLRIADHLPRLLATAADLGVTAAYEMQAVPWRPPRELLKDALVNVSRLNEDRAVPRELLAEQTGLAERLRQAEFLVEESLASETPEGLEALRRTFSNLLAGSLYGRFGIEPAFEPLDEVESDAFSYHVHSELVGEPQAVGFEGLAAAAVRSDIDRILGCESLGFDTVLDSGGSEPIRVQVSGGNGGMPPSMGGNGAGRPFMFVSYARADKEIVYPLVSHLTNSGLSLWIDKEINTGNDWVVEIEDRLVNCRGVLAFITPAYAASKNCGREIRVADALDRTILPVMVEMADLYGSGLGFLLGNIQRIDRSSPDLAAAILNAARLQTPDVIGSGVAG